MKFEVKLGIGLLVLGGLYGLLRYESFYVEKKEAREKESSTFVSITFSKIKRLTLLQPREQRQILIEKMGDSDHWELIQDDQRLRAHTPALQKIVEQLNDAVAMTYFDINETDPAVRQTYGLDDPLLDIRIQFADKEIKLLMTKSIPSGSSGEETSKGYYAWNSQKPDRLFVLEAFLYTELKKYDVASLRNRKPLNLKTVDVQYLSVHDHRGLNSRFEIERSESDWVFKPPYKRPVDQDAISLFLDRLGRLEVAEVLDQSQVDFSGAPPIYEVHLKTKENMTQHFQVFEKTGEYYLNMAENAYGKLGETAWSDFHLTLNAVTQRKLFQNTQVFEAYQRAALKGHKFVRQGVSWLLETSGDQDQKEKEKKGQDFKTFLDTLLTQVADEVNDDPHIVNGPKLNFKDIVWSLRLDKGENDDSPLIIEVGQPIDQKYPLRISDRNDYIYFVNNFWEQKIPIIDKNLAN